MLENVGNSLVMKKHKLMSTEKFMLLVTQRARKRTEKPLFELEDYSNKSMF